MSRGLLHFLSCALGWSWRTARTAITAFSQLAWHSIALVRAVQPPSDVPSLACVLLPRRLAAAGILIPEGLQANGANIKGGTWFETGAEMLNGGTLNYFAVPWGIVSNPLPLFAVIAVEVGLMGAVEFYRRNGTGPAGYSPGIGKFDSSVFDGLDPLYPGGPFDPLGLADDPEVLQELKVKEIKNGRLAMVSVLGFAVQSYVTGEGPYANWTKHVADPFGYNLLTVLGAEERTPTL